MKKTEDEVIDGEIIDPEEEARKAAMGPEIGLAETLADPKEAFKKASQSNGVATVGKAVVIGALAGAILPGIGSMIGAGIGGIIGGSMAVSKGVKQKKQSEKIEIRVERKLENKTSKGKDKNKGRS